MRIAIFGAGAVGSHLGLRLAQAGHDVAFVARGAHLAALRRDGIALEADGRIDRAPVRASDDASQFGVQDVVVVASKATSLAAAVPALRALVGPSTVAVFLQNGMPWWYPVGLPAGHRTIPDLPIFALAQPLLDVLRPAQVLSAVVYSANEMVEPGLVRNNSPESNRLLIAAPHPDAQARVDAFRDTIAATAIQAPVTPDARAAMWLKLVGNAASSAISVASGNPTAPSTDDALRETFVRIVDEGIAVAAAYGFDLSGLIDTARWTQRKGAHRPSLLQDYESGRPMEVAEMVLAPGQFGRHAGVPTPTLDAIAAVVRCRAIDRGLYTR